MNCYIQEVERIKNLYFSNEYQIDVVVNTKRYIDQYYSHKLNLDHLAHQQFTSKFHLIRLFKRYYGTTPRQYLIQKRMQIAKKLLKEGNTVTDACIKVGFESVHSFSNLFKSKTGMTPSMYKRATFDKTKP